MYTYRRKIRIIRKKKKTPKERFFEFIKTAYGKKVLSAIGVIFVLLIIYSRIGNSELGYFDYVGNEKRIEYLKSMTQKLYDSRKMALLNEYKDGFCIFGVHRDSILFTEIKGKQKKFQLDWNKTIFKSDDRGINITLPVIENLEDGMKIFSRNISIKRDHEYSFNSLNGTNLLLKAEQADYTAYGKIILIGIQSKL